MEIFDWEIIHYGGFFVCAKFYEQILIKTNIF